MADEADLANQHIEQEMALRLSRIAYTIPEGPAGECELCGEWAGRLVKGVCSPCRDSYVKRGLPDPANG